MAMGQNTEEVFTRWDPIEWLATDADQAAYLRASLADDPGDGSLVRAAVVDIARARAAQAVSKLG